MPLLRNRRQIFLNIALQKTQRFIWSQKERMKKVETSPAMSTQRKYFAA